MAKSSTPSIVTIVLNKPVLPQDHPDYESEAEVIETVELIEEALKKSEIQTERIMLDRDLAPFWNRMQANKPEVIFNMFEGFADDTESEVHFAGLLDWFKIPYTGSNSAAIAIGRNKILAKSVLQAAGVSTPRFFTIVNTDTIPENNIGWPLIIKPATQDASIGIEQASVVTNQEKLEERAKYILNKYGPPVLAEEFIDGREFTAAVIENPELKVLAPSEVHFPIRDKGLWPIISYDAKWAPESLEFEGTPYEYPAKISPELLSKVKKTVANAYRAIGLRDYGRIDMRISKNETVYVIEANPNPDLHVVAGLAISLESVGLTYEDFLRDLVISTWKRNQD